MASESSFDVVSQFDRQELVNAIDQVEREVTTRYDLKSTGTEIQLTTDKLTVATGTDFTLKQVRDVIVEKLTRRNLDTRILDWGKVTPAARGTVRQEATLKQGITAELGREMVKFIKSANPKTRPQIQGDAVRVFAKSRDELQSVIQSLKQKEWPAPLQFVNYR
ncbi:MAG: YajQ family cyclic di-GMP-binding protein [Chloroflexota bacterium]|nr:MAG: YajQ family cyclic di-GMP-binding protein [Chloroflexota bacterium]